MLLVEGFGEVAFDSGEGQSLGEVLRDALSLGEPAEEDFDGDDDQFNGAGGESGAFAGFEEGGEVFPLDLGGGRERGGF